MLEKNNQLLKENSDKISTGLFEDLINDDRFIHDDNIDTFINIFPNLNKSQQKKFLQLLGLSEFIKLLDKKPAVIEVSNINEKIILAFKKYEIIESYTQSEGNTESYQIKFPNDFID